MEPWCQYSSASGLCGERAMGVGASAEQYRALPERTKYAAAQAVWIRRIKHPCCVARLLSGMYGCSSRDRYAAELCVS